MLTNGQTDERGPVVAIVGAGFAGTATAVELLRKARTPLRIVLIDRSGRFGPGVAYSTPSEQHLLNQPASRMSLFADAPDDFRAWAAARLGACEPAAFLSRRLYGAYLSERLDEAASARAAGVELERRTGELTAVEPHAAGARLTFADGATLHCARAVLALGAPPPGPPSGLPDDPRVFADPWLPGALDAPPAGTVALIGAGLTAIDATLSLCATPGVRVLAISRSGRLPRAHLSGDRTPATVPRPAVWPADADALERYVRGQIANAEAAGFDWRDAVDGIRALVPELWRALPPGEQRRLLATRMREWETSRHRMAPAVAERIRALREQGRLEVLAANVLGGRPAAAGIELALGIAERGEASQALRLVTATRVIACAGFGSDVAAYRPLRELLADGHASPDALGLGLRAAADGALLDADERPSRTLFTLGAPRRGELWETTAAREIREQARLVAAALLAAPTAVGSGR